jgi:N-acetylmuramoyl-L-alanine amidase
MRKKYRTLFLTAILVVTLFAQGAAYSTSLSLRPKGGKGVQISKADKVGKTDKRVAASESPSRGVSNRDEYMILAHLIYGEARGEPYVGKVAVGAVVLNRVKSSKFSNSISGVIYQPGAFTAVAEGQMWMDPDNESVRAAKDALSGWDPSGGAIYYYNPAKTRSRWIWARPVLTVIGRHRFAR